MNQQRRSWLLTPLSRPREVEDAARCGADVVVLDLVELVREEEKHAARLGVAAAIGTAQAAGAEAFVMIDPLLAYADLHACVWPGLAGVVIARAQTPSQVEEIAALLGELEGSRGILPGSLEIAAALETAAGNQAAYEIARASPRVRTLTLGRADLVMDLRPEPCGEIHLLPYLMQRLVIVAGAAGATPIGAWWRSPDRGLLATPQNTGAAARRGRAIGFKGAMCLRANQVDALNCAYARS
ncbi:MAG: CoA ester lyase [Burkholderiales bacterium]|nr:CoA ester lyase [Burkholderiales bacterium]